MKAIYLISAVLLVNGCNSPKPQKEKPIKVVYSINNKGTLCYKRSKPKELLVALFPINSSCAPSNVYSYNLRVIVTPMGAEHNIETLGTYTKYRTNIATADCAGAGIVVKRQKLNSAAPITIYWDNHMLGILPNKLNRVYCYRRDGDNITQDYSLVKYFTTIPNK